MDIVLKAAKVPFNVEVDGSVLKLEADYCDGNLTEAMKIVSANGPEIERIADESAERGYEVPEDYAAMAEAVRPLISLIIGEKGYKSVLKVLGGDESKSASQMMLLYAALVAEVGERFGAIRRGKASRYLNDAV